MKQLILKDNLTQDELCELDSYFDLNISELLEFDNDVIIRFIDECENAVGFSSCVSTLEYHLQDISYDVSYNINENNLAYYDKLIELASYFKFSNNGIAYKLGDYFYDEDDNKAIEYYRKAFKKGFDICQIGYYHSLVHYLKLLNKNPSEELKELISNSPLVSDYTLDSSNTYLLLIINLEKFSDEYLYYINKAIIVASEVVEIYRRGKSKNSFMDSEEERNLCELYALKMEYYVEKREYVKAFDMYKELTNEIGRSNCTRYYHGRDYFYSTMLEYMCDDYPELLFFDYIGHHKFEVMGSYNELNINQEVILLKQDGLIFKFKIVDIQEDDYTIVPILPIIGEGARVFTKIIKENGKIYLKNRLGR